jgi:hypothetical protein
VRIAGKPWAWWNPGYGRPEDRSAAHAAGFDVYLVKPPEIDALKGLLANGRLSADI